MARKYTCDYCGEPIESQCEYAHLSAVGWESFGDYHRSPCLVLIKQAVDAARAGRIVDYGVTSVGQRVAPSERMDRYREVQDLWLGLSVYERERLTLEKIGGAARPLTIAEVAARVNDHFGGGWMVCGSQVGVVVRRLHQAGEVDRLRVEPGSPGEHHATRWRWARKAALSGPIADLERALDDGTGGE